MNVKKFIQKEMKSINDNDKDLNKRYRADK